MQTQLQLGSYTSMDAQMKHIFTNLQDLISILASLHYACPNRDQIL